MLAAEIAIARPRIVLMRWPRQRKLNADVSTMATSFELIHWSSVPRCVTTITPPGNGVAAGTAETRDLDAITLIDLDAASNIDAPTFEHPAQEGGLPSVSFEQVAAGWCGGSPSPGASAPTSPRGRGRDRLPLPPERERIGVRGRAHI